MPSVAALPQLISRKLYKTGQSRGATVREIYQNRVLRNSTVLIPYEWWEECQEPDDDLGYYENGYIVLLDPEWYFTTPDVDELLASQDLAVGHNALLLYQRRSEWLQYSTRLPNGERLKIATSRLPPLGGNYFARVHSTTAQGDSGVVHGFNETKLRGAGIRVYEYASSATITASRTQLEALLWRCEGAIDDMVQAGMTAAAARRRSAQVQEQATKAGLLDLQRLEEIRAINEGGFTICPLCREQMRALGFMDRTTQAAGREVYDLTTTEVSLFHIQELRMGTLQHKPYNVGWGHHHCNVVVKDAGIMPTLKWMRDVLDNQGDGSLEEQERSVEKAVG